MDEISLRQEILKGEDNRRQFKREVTNSLAIASEVAAFLNSAGGHIFIGVERDGAIKGLSTQQIEKLNQLISNAITQSIEPPVGVETENVSTSDGTVLVVTIDEGPDKPYQTSDGYFWVKRGSDKQRANSRTELKRMFQMGHDVYAEMRPVPGATVATLDEGAYGRFYTEKYFRPVPEDEVMLERELTASRLMQGDLLTTAGVLLFSKQAEQLLPAFCLKAVWFKGNDRSGIEFHVNDRFVGTLGEQFEKGMAFFRRWNSRIADNRSFNTSRLEIPEYVFEELLTNALVHRDYFIDDSVKLFVFDNRIEIRSPGRLPNSLTVDAIRHGVRRDRNPVLVSFAYDVMKYRGLGSGMLRVLSAIPDLGIENDVEAEEVTVIIPLATGQAPAQGTEA